MKKIVFDLVMNYIGEFFVVVDGVLWNKFYYNCYGCVWSDYFRGFFQFKYIFIVI